MSRTTRAPDLFSDLDHIVRELRRLHRIVGSRFVVDPRKLALLKRARGDEPRRPRARSRRERTS